MSMKNFSRFILLFLVAAILMVFVNFMPQDPAMPRIAVKSIYGHSTFYDKLTQTEFIPRGVNFNTLHPPDPAQPKNLYHVTFDPGFYSAPHVEAHLEYISSSGYNFVRVFVASIFSGAGFGRGGTGPGIDSAYLANLVDFIARARSKNLLVMLTGEGIPSNYISRHVPELANVDSAQSSYNGKLLLQSRISDNARFWQDLLGAIKAQSPSLLSSIFAIDINNEMFVDLAAPPFSLNSGTFVNAQGNEFNLGDMNQRRRLLDVATVHFVNQMVDAIKRVHPGLLVGVSVFPAIAAGLSIEEGPVAKALTPGKHFHFPLRPETIAFQTKADYIDMHLYPEGSSVRIDELMRRSEIPRGKNMQKPILMGEYGAHRANYPNPQQAANGLTDFLKRSCEYGFKGWAFWTWEAPSQSEFFWMLTEQNGALNGAMAPKNWSTICPRSTKFLSAAVFDPRWYLAKYPDLAAALGDQNIEEASNHWLTHGIAEGRQGNFTFSASTYLSFYQDVAHALGAENYVAAIEHYLNHGIYEGRAGALELRPEVFDARWYLDHNQDLQNAFGPNNITAATEHWLNHGLREGRQGSASFSARTYLARYPDIASAFGAGNFHGAISHFIHNGLRERRSGL